MNEREFRVQYLDGNGAWTNTGFVYSTYNEAVDLLLREAKNDPEYTHRIVRIDVVGYIAGQGEFDE